jgi:hypothetical protein
MRQPESTFFKKLLRLKHIPRYSILFAENLFFISIIMIGNHAEHSPATAINIKKTVQITFVVLNLTSYVDIL